MTATSPAPKPAHFLINFRDIIAAPRQALKRVSSVQVHSWWFPVLLSLLTPILHVGLTLDLQVARAKKIAALQLSNMTPEQAEAARNAIERMTQPTTLLMTHAVQTVLGLAFAWALAMLILYFSIALFGTAIKTNSLWAAVAWAWIPFALRPIAQLIFNLYSGTLIRYPGLSYFFASGKIADDQKNPLFIAATHLDLFTLWHLVLIFLLLRTVGKLGRGSSFFVTGLYAFIQLGVRLLPTLIPKWLGMG
ncbi:MAG TPA: hypothetical protein ENK60_02025 [Anaerolineae bacterium]|nr:hypothetical protein [Anaerolineae bacterium]